MDRYDVVVVGGGAAGLSAALMLGRSRRRVLVVDAGEPRNAPAAAMHGFLGRDGTPPLALLADGRAEVASYGVEVVGGRVVDAAGGVDDFAVTLDDGRRFGARRLVLTTGLVDDLPAIPGLRELWGTDVLHCPYCHGWEVRDRAIGVLASHPSTVHIALLFRQLSSDAVYFTHTAPPPDDDRELLEAVGVEVVDGEVVALDVDGGRLAAVRLAGGSAVTRDALAVKPQAVVGGPLLASLGVPVEEHPAGVGTHVPCDATGRTAVDGVWVAGNATDPSATVVVAAAGGAKAGGAVNADLAMADAVRSRAARRSRPSPAPAATPPA